MTNILVSKRGILREEKNLGEENSSQGKGCFLRKEEFENLQV